MAGVCDLGASGGRREGTEPQSTAAQIGELVRKPPTGPVTRCDYERDAVPDRRLGAREVPGKRVTGNAPITVLCAGWDAGGQGRGDGAPLGLNCECRARGHRRCASRGRIDFLVWGGTWARIDRDGGVGGGLILAG